MSKLKRKWEYLRDFVEASLTEREREEAALLVRPGVTWDGVEVFLGGKVTIVPQKRLDRAVDDGNIASLAVGVLGQLRKNHYIDGDPGLNVYDVRDLEGELLHQLEELACRLGVEVPSREGAPRPPAGELRKARQRLADEIVERCKKIAKEREK